MPAYRISEKALQDLENIWLYTLHEWSLRQADRYYQLLISEMEYISHNVEAGKNMDYLRKGYRRHWVMSHFIFYKRGEDGAVEIIRVLHQSMDVAKRLTE